MLPKCETNAYKLENVFVCQNYWKRIKILKKNKILPSINFGLSKVYENLINPYGSKCAFQAPLMRDQIYQKYIIPEMNKDCFEWL